MKGGELRNVVLSKLENGEQSSLISRDLNGQVSTRTIERWRKQLREEGVIEPSFSPGRKRSVRTAMVIQKAKRILKSKCVKSKRALGRKLGMSATSAYRVLTDDLRCKAYKMIREPKLTDKQKLRRVAFSNWIRNNFRKSDTLKFVFSDEKIFAVDGVYNRQNDRVWAVSRRAADEQGAVRRMSKFPGKIMIWLAVCTKGVSRVVFLENGKVDHNKYIDEVLPVVRKFGNRHFGNDWTFQQDGATAHTDKKTQKWCAEELPAFLEKADWPANSPDLNPLDYSIWNEIVQGMKWDRVTSKSTLKSQIQLAVKRIRHRVILDSCTNFYTRVRQLACSKGDYIRSHVKTVSCSCQ